MTLSVLIATCNRPQLLDKCLRSLLCGTRLPEEIVVADQSDDDLTESIVRSKPESATRLLYLKLDRKGKSHALNLALARSTGELLALTDDDVEVDPTWLEQLERVAAEHRDAAAFCGRVLPEPGSDPRDYLNLVLSTKQRWITGKANPMSPGFVGANIAVWRAALVAIGGYNVHFGPGATFVNNDDGELAYRLTRHGERILFAPELVVYHSSWRKERDTLALRWDYTHSLGAFAGYYLRRGHLRPSLYLAKKAQFKLRQLARGLMSGDRDKTRDAKVQLGGMGTGFLRGVRTGNRAEAGRASRTTSPEP